MIYKYILFDLDGTLTDPGEGITNSVMHALGKMGFDIPERSQLYKFIGPPLTESFEKYYNIKGEDVDTAIKYYREYFKDKGIFENKVYCGIEDLLRELKADRKILILATSKPEVFAKRILEHFNLIHYFDFIAGSILDGTRVNKDEVISYALTRCNITDLKHAVMVGDRKHDIMGAKKNGIDSIGVLYGYGTKEELQNAGADYIAETINEIGEIINHKI